MKNEKKISQGAKLSFDTMWRKTRISHSSLNSIQPYNYIQQQKERIRKELETTLLKIPTN